MTTIDDRDLRDELGALDRSDLQTALLLLSAARSVQADELARNREAILTTLMVAGEPVLPFPSLAQAARLATHRNRLLQTPWFGYEALSRVRGDSSESATRTWVTRARERRSMFTLLVQGRTVIPAFQLTDSGQVRDDLAPALRELIAADVDGWELWSWLTTPTGWLSGEVPEQAARTDPARVARAAVRFLDT